MRCQGLFWGVFFQTTRWAHRPHLLQIFSHFPVQWIIRHQTLHQSLRGLWVEWVLPEVHSLLHAHMPALTLRHTCERADIHIFTAFTRAHIHLLVHAATPRSQALQLSGLPDEVYGCIYHCLPPGADRQAFRTAFKATHRWVLKKIIHFFGALAQVHHGFA